MKYGLILNFATDNIGDDIQSYAAAQFLPSIDCVIDRESLDRFDNSDEPVKAIMNGWYMYDKFNWPPSADIDPLWVSVHISEADNFGIGEKFLSGPGGEYLRQYAPIGARDESTLEMLRHNGIDAELSGCLTLTLPRCADAEKTDEILLVDVGPTSEQTIREHFPNERYASVTHAVNPETYRLLTVKERMEKAAALLRRYQGAKCVVTSRLHCALPCLALGTPVLLLYKDEYASRMKSFLELLHYSTLDGLNAALRSYDLTQPPENSTAFLPIREKLIRVCKDFVSSPVKKRAELPPLEELHRWQKELLQPSELHFRREIARLTSWIGELEKSRSYISGQCEIKDARIRELEQWNVSQEAAKTYLSEQCETKDSRIRELESWIGELEKARDYLSGQCTMKDARIHELEEWCQTVTEGKDYVEAQWHQAQDAATALQKKLNLLLADVEIQKTIQKRSYNI